MDPKPEAELSQLTSNSNLTNLNATLQTLLAATAMGSPLQMQQQQQLAHQGGFMAPALAAQQMGMNPQLMAGQQSYGLLQTLLQPQYPMLGNMMAPAEQPRPAEPAPRTTSRGRAAKSGDTSGRPANSYASRHQQAEARRRMRINERLDALRCIVPHTERANTAVFLEDVIRYVQMLQARVFELETKLGFPVSVTVSPPIRFGESATPDGTIATAATTGASSMERLALQAAIQQAAVVNAVAAANAANGDAAVLAAAVAANASAGIPPRPPALPSASEELAMAKDLGGGDTAAAAGATMAESQPAAAAKEVRAKREMNKEGAEGNKRRKS